MSNSKVTVNEKQWKSFSKVLQGLSKQCNDADVNDGMIRQRSNDRFAIFEVDLKPLLGDSTFAISEIKEKLKFLKGLEGDVTIEADQDKVVFSDGAASYSIPAPDMSFLDNPYLTKPNFDSLLPNTSQGTIHLIKHKIGKKQLKRIRNAVSTLHGSSYKVVFEDQSASIRVEERYAQSKGAKSFVDLVKDIPLLEPITGSANLSISPLDSFDYDGDINWEIYREDRVVISKHSGSVGGVTTVAYARSPLPNDSVEPPPPQEETTVGEAEPAETET